MSTGKFKALHVINRFKLPEPNTFLGRTQELDWVVQGDQLIIKGKRKSASINFDNLKLCGVAVIWLKRARKGDDVNRDWEIKVKEKLFQFHLVPAARCDDIVVYTIAVLRESRENEILISGMSRIRFIFICPRQSLGAAEASVSIPCKLREATIWLDFIHACEGKCSIRRNCLNVKNILIRLQLCGKTFPPASLVSWMKSCSHDY